MCGILAALLGDADTHVNQLIVDGLTVLQHRGQDAAGIVTCEKGHLNLRKDSGLVSEVFQHHHMLTLRGNLGIGHVRYPTAGTSSCAEAQPLFTNYPYGICAAHNGNITNTAELRAALVQSLRHINTGSDSELVLNVFAEELQAQHKGRDICPTDVFEAVRKLMARCHGAYGVVMLVNGVGLLGFRDPHGIRPLVLGTRNSTTQAGVTDFLLASESVAIDTLRFSLVGDVGPGEAILITTEGKLHRSQCARSPQLMPCIFEYVYFARPDSIMDGVQVYEARLNMGERLAESILRKYPQHDIDVVIPVPDTSRTSGLSCAYTLGRPFREGFIKNRYIARTFIMPGQAVRMKTVRMKLNTIRSEFRGKNVLLVDDSIVRGTTSRELVSMAREAGARKVYVTSAAPAVRYPNVYGIDIPTRIELIANERDEAQVAAELGADWVVYQALEDLKTSIRKINPSIQEFDASCFDGRYVTGDITDEYLVELQGGRGKKQGHQQQQAEVLRGRAERKMVSETSEKHKTWNAHDGNHSASNCANGAPAEAGAAAPAGMGPGAASVSTRLSSACAEKKLGGSCEVLFNLGRETTK
ncbi:hypothetical protein NSK_003842 [Nannochloropsis salina CCMP1776]|uniref:Amidophosphoribosyltransferase n=1 Tax=Nannochloropsis salina CCMP1776 TaxID=1027361 RepID=A0A4D9D0B8_9STRA|nr:hypothetical protein NSK_003842 [Nannochloropsis salina CCMP1776]|eukprot:TFJ84810.1 hypothetical protein NSK_003842 [Nannochloropsis salina CCMP1776]